MSDQSLFDSLADLTHYERPLKIGRAEDIIKVAEEDGKTRFEIREGAVMREIKVRALTEKERTEMERLVNRILPPQLYKEEIGEGGKVTGRTPIGFNEEDPTFLSEKDAAISEQRAKVALLGCKELRESTPGENVHEKSENLRNKLDEQLICFIASNVWNLGYAAGDAAAFFSKGASGSTPS